MPITAGQAVLFMNPRTSLRSHSAEPHQRETAALPGIVSRLTPGADSRFDTDKTLGQHVEMRDSELVEAFLAGDTSAVRIVEGWVRSSASPFRQSLGEDWQDAVQDAMIAVLEQLRAGRFEGRSSLKTYVWRLAAYRLTDRFRSRKKRHWIALEAEPLQDDRPGPLKQAQERDRWRVARRVMSRLSENCRQLWRMTLAGLDYAQMSEELTVSEGTLRVRMLRCRDRALKLEEKLSLPAIGGA